MQNKHFSACYTQDDFYTNTYLTHYSNALRILMVGDVVGKCGRNVLKTLLPLLKRSFQIDFIVINAENIAGGFGITEKTYLEMNAIGVDVFTMGNHWQDKPNIFKLREKYKKIVLPQNLLNVQPDVAEVPSFFCESKNKTIHIINLMGRFAMKADYGKPLEFLQNSKEKFQTARENGDIILADIHAEGNSEKQAIAWFYDGICAAIVGTHTHVPTSDERILNKGTAYLTDLGMTGGYESVTGMNKERVVQRMLHPEQKCAFEVSDKQPWFAGFLIDVNPDTSLAKQCARLQCRLSQNMQEQSWFLHTILA